MMAPREVLERYPGIQSGCRWHPLTNSGGFSGAILWRGELDGVPIFALKRYPAEVTNERVQQIHDWQKLTAALPFVPRLIAATNRETRIEHGGFLWELSSWMPGVAHFHREPCEAKLRSACEAIFQLHDVWKILQTPPQPIPAIQRRIDLLTGWKPTSECGIRAEADAVVRRLRPAILDELQSWQTRRFPLQPCLADVHREHVLFTGTHVTGIIDYGAMKLDHVAVDAARFLGDACAEDLSMYRLGCELFVHRYGNDHCPVELMELLDRSGNLGAIAFWLKRNDPSPKAQARLARLLGSALRATSN